MFGWETFRLINTFAMVEIIGNFFKFSIILMYDVKTRQLLSVHRELKRSRRTRSCHTLLYADDGYVFMLDCL